MTNVIIVESKNDKIFFETLIRHMNVSGVTIDESIILPDEAIISIDGIDPNPVKPTKLIRKLNDIKTEILKVDIRKIGIIIDLDNHTVSERLAMVNNAVYEAFGTGHPLNEIQSESTFTKISTTEWEVEIACYFTNVDNNGELETVLRAIATEQAVHANCLQSWRDCLGRNSITITDKDFDKFWIANYIRFDTCRREEKKQAGKFCSMQNFGHVMTKGVFNLDARELDDIKRFLELFRR
jgi:hypothetical protein